MEVALHEAKSALAAKRLELEAQRMADYDMNREFQQLQSVIEVMRHLSETSSAQQRGTYE